MSMIISQERGTGSEMEVFMVIVTFLSALFFFLIAFLGRSKAGENKTRKDKMDEAGLYLITVVLIILGICMMLS